jgi:Tol biopolymer transport system component
MLRALFTSLALCASIVIGAPIAVFGLAHDATRGNIAGLPGSLLFLRFGEVWQLDLQTLGQRMLIKASNGSITHVAHSPDRQRIAYSVLSLSPTYQVTGGEIMVANADGSDPQTLVRQEGGTAAVGWPAWSGDGTRVAYDVSGLVDASHRIEEVEVQSGTRFTLAASGSQPALSPDGRWLVYTDRGYVAWSIWSFDRTTSGTTKVVPEEWFKDSDVPTFSPDGSTLVFVAAGAGPAQGALTHVLGLLGTTLGGVAGAHDLAEPFDLWTIAPDGSSPRRLAALRNVQPYLAWSPDGRYIAAWGASGLQIVDTAANNAVHLESTDPGAAGISWGV